MQVTLSNPIIAHRGAGALAPENTLPAYQAAYQLGAPMIEVDAWRTTDGKLVIMHDDTVDRTTSGKGRVDSFSFDQLRRLDAGSWFGSQFKGAQVPTLGEVLDYARGKMKVDIHVREADNYPGLEKDVVDLIHQKKAEDNVLVTAFEPAFLKKVHDLDPNLATGTLLDTHPLLNTVKKGVEVGLGVGAIVGLASGVGLLGAAAVALAGGIAGFVASREAGLKSVRDQLAHTDTPVVLPFWAQCDSRFMAEASAEGKQVIPYVTDAPALVDWMLHRDGVSAVITDNAERFQNEMHAG